MKMISLFDIVLAEIKECTGSVISFSSLAKIKKLCDKADEIRMYSNMMEIHSISVDVDEEQYAFTLQVFTDNVEINKREMVFADLMMCADCVSFATNEENDLGVRFGIRDIW